MSAANPRLRLRRWWWIAAIVAAGYVAVLWFAAFALQDIPNHLARAVILDDLLLHHGQRFGGLYQFHPLAIPYLLHDLALTLCVALLGPRTASGLWLGMVFLSIPAAILLYLRAERAGPRTQLIGFLLGTYLATGWFFTMGFDAFQLGMALMLIALSLAERLRRRWSAWPCAAYVAVLVAGYLTHLTALVFVAPAIALLALFRLHSRSSSLRTEALLLVPVIALLAWHFGVATRFHQPGDASIGSYLWGTWLSKVQRVLAPFHRYGGMGDRVLPLLLAASLLVLAVGRLRLAELAGARSREPSFHSAQPRYRSFETGSRSLEMIALAAAFAALYVILPIGYRDAWYVDVRALEPASIFLLLAVLLLPEQEGARAAQYAALSLAGVLAIANLAVLREHVRGGEAWIAQYRSIARQLPMDARVLPIDTRSAHAPYLHAWSGAVIDRQALSPYLFSANTGDPVEFFRYRDRPYAPDEAWYVSRRPLLVDWRRIACTYQYLLVTEPFDPRRIALTTSTVARNRAATLLAVSPRSCAQLAAAGERTERR